MKTIRSGLSNVLVLVLLAALSVLLIALLSNANSGSATSIRSPLTTPTIASARVSPLATPGVSSTSSVPLARIGAPVLLKSVDQLGPLNIGQDKFAGVVGQGLAARTIVLDPTTGATQTVANTGLWGAQVAGHWLVYEDQTVVDASHYYSQIKVRDLGTGKEIILGDEHILQHDPSISGDIVVWDESQNGMLSSIYGYDLAASKKFPIIVKPGSRGYPRISGQWMTYVQWPGLNPTGNELSIELHAYSLKTNEDILIGLIPSPKDAGWGTQYALDEDKIVWNKSLGNQSELHLYDLTTRTDRTLFGPANGIAYDLSISARSGVIVSPGKVMDWRQPEPVDLAFDWPPLPPGASHDSFFVFGDHLFWRVLLDKEGSQVQVFVAPITR